MFCFVCHTSPVTLMISDNLLKERAKLWITLRGNSYADYLTEQYKQAVKECTDQQKSLRKTVKLPV